ncbi:porin family protein [uncultured Rikenella sp.]|uniref:porin family protein n=1 Tax=uncultured Rikenella sp. TaxID=368003 RepID=UPI0026188322|nr:porin family protein [uncultured Rikenella sp.]
MQTKKRFVQILFMAIFGLGLNHSASAQDFYWGPRVGMNVSSMTKTTYSKARIRGSFGLMAGYKINDLIGLQAEALYSLQGSKVDNNEKDIYSYNYVKIPVLAKVYLIGGLNLEAGVAFNWLVKAQQKWNSSSHDVNGNVIETTTHTRSLIDDCKSFDLTIPVGINYQFRRWFDLGVRYDISTIRVSEDKKDHAKSSVLSVNLGLRF